MLVAAAVGLVLPFLRLTGPNLGEVPAYNISAAAIVVVLIAMSKAVGPLSFPTLLTAIIFVPAFAPFYARTIFGAEFYAGRNLPLQLDPALTNNISWLLTASLLVYTAAITLAMCTRIIGTQLSLNVTPFVSRTWYFVFCALTLVFAFLADPGPTLLTATRIDSLTGRLPEAQSAGALLIIVWVFAFINYRVKERFYRVGSLFLSCTFAVMAWRLLHGSRNEFTGMLVILAVFWASERRRVLPMMSLLGLAGLLLIIVGNTRAQALSTLNLGELIAAILPQTAGRTSTMPGGVSDIFLTMLDADNIVALRGYLAGQTYITYVYQLIPTPLIHLVGGADPVTFSDVIISNHLDYNGGDYVFAPALANFGVPGVLTVALLLGALVAGVDRAFRGSSVSRQAVSLTIVGLFTDAMWYDALNLVKFGVYTLAIIVVFRVVAIARPSGQVAARGDVRRAIPWAS